MLLEKYLEEAAALEAYLCAAANSVGETLQHDVARWERELYDTMSQSFGK